MSTETGEDHFGPDGRPSRLYSCATAGWHFKNASIPLTCAASVASVVCSGSSGGLASNDSPNDYGFDGVAIARSARTAGAPVAVDVTPGTAPAPMGSRTSFPCGASRCTAGTDCCPALGQCFKSPSDTPPSCKVDGLCDQRTNEPCAPAEVCAVHKAGPAYCEPR